MLQRTFLAEKYIPLIQKYKKNMAAVCIIHIDVALNLFYGHSYFQNNKEKKNFQHINKTNFKNNN